MKSPAGGDGRLLVAFFCSGAAGLGYEIVWTRLLALSLGSETLGVLGVLAGFFAGLALGGWAFHRRVRRAASPARLFAALEAAAALFAVASPHLLYGLARVLPPLLGPVAGDNDSWRGLALSLLVATVALLPGTVPLGATLAALVEARRRRQRDDEGRGVGRLYAANTFGAVAGTLVSLYLLLPRLGLGWGAAVLAAVGLFAAALALSWSARSEAPGAAATAGATPSVVEERGAAPALAAAADALHGELPATARGALLFATGLAGLGLEIVAVQVLAQPLDDTVFTFGNLLAVFLLGTALGAALFTAWRRSRRLPPRALAAALLAAHGVAAVLAGWVLRQTPALLSRWAPEGAPFGRYLGAELALAAAVLLVPTVLMGALFSHLMAGLERDGVGRAYALNTLGAALAPFVFGLGGFRLLGYAGTLVAVAAVYLLLALAVAAPAALPRYRLAGAAAASLALLALLALAPRSLALVEPEPGWRVRWRREGLLGLVTVTEAEGSRQRRLQINKHFRMGATAAFGERRLGHLPLLLAPHARRALYLGIGTGATLGAVREAPRLERVDAVELVPEVLAALPLFELSNQQVWRDPRVRFHAADARRFVAARAGRYDLVVGDLFHPARDGAGTLYAREHFAAVRQSLAPGGLYAQWLPLYQLDERNLRTIVRTFLDVFPEVHSFLGIYNAATPALALVGRVPAALGERLRIDVDELGRALAHPVYGELMMDDPRDLVASYMLDRAALARFAGAGPLNTDLDPRVLFDAPPTSRRLEIELGRRNLALLLPRRVSGAALLAGSGPRAATLRAEAGSYGRALELYLRGELARTATPGGGIPPAAVELYLRAFEAEPAFAPARQVLLYLAERNPAHRASLLQRMLARAPSDATLRGAASALSIEPR